MAFRKSVSFRNQTETTVFFYNQPPNIVLERYSEEVVDENSKEETTPAYCKFYEIGTEEEETTTETVRFIKMTEINNMETHFILYVDCPGESSNKITSTLLEFFSKDGVETITVVKPLKRSNATSDFKIGYEGVLIGVTLKLTENCEKYILSQNQLEIPNLNVKLIPGARGEHFWEKYLIDHSFLQGFFFVGPDPVDVFPNLFCYLASFPKYYSNESIGKEIYSHTNEYPLRIISNPLECGNVLRLEFQKPETVRILLKRCMNFDGKPVLILPCIDRTPIEVLLEKHMVSVCGYTNAINPKEFIRMLTDMCGPLAELNINYEGHDTLAVFQNVSAAANCLNKKEVFLRNHKIRFKKPLRPFGITGLKFHKGKYRSEPPERPLPLVPAPYNYEPSQKKKLDRIP